MGKLSGKVAIVTGAAMGNGEGMARVMARHGAHVALWDRSDSVFATARTMQDEGLSATPYKVDVTRFEACCKATDAILQANGRIDILCNNAGVARLANFLEMDDNLRDFHFSVNIIGGWNATKAVLPSMKARRYGKIVNMSSVTGPMVVDEGMSAYATSKAAIIGFTKALARDMAKYGINVNAICPGYILTPMVEHTARQSNPSDPQRVIAGIAAGVPLGRLGTPAEIGELAAFLASDEASYITGTQIVIDGGSTLPETMTVGA
ncbi:oxidoreductase UcpA [Desulfosarcina ovata subsp. sediminis]|uniref:Oxidoreductase UcpA n=1 Tax=Desulfosarcina ovata subsp. sediminis TaxID=885957 RepID=A0A5K7ZG63_9BACT|nr:SDR family oxidoreductase UcpA [Desulfosarcina ovata]BBO79901.1 oxidoreductase UcpA [Desulfosarcina ovata subsp. sediminis]